MQRHFQRARLLMEQARPAQAVDELRLCLVEEPNNADAHALLAICLCNLEKFGDATNEAQQAVHLGPDLGLTHYALATVLFARNRFAEAEQAIDEAIALDPHHDGYHAQLASIRFAQANWQGALETANQALAIDPENVDAANIRAAALVKLNRTREAGATIDSALAKRPDNAMTHCNQGWLMLERNRPKDAMIHFREALRLDPQLEYARQGIVQELKAHNPLYRLLLQYFLWMAKLSSGARWGVIIGLYALNRVLRVIVAANPALAPLLVPVMALYVAFVVLTWIATPLFTLLLRLHPFGRLALSRDEIVASNWFAALALGAIVSLAAWAITGLEGLGWLGGVCAIMTLPTSGVFACDPGWPRRSMAIYTVCTFAAGVTSCALMLAADLLADDPAHLESISHIFLVLCIVGVVGFAWVGNILSQMTPKR